MESIELPTVVAASAESDVRATPVNKSSRIDDMDIIRGMALFGVLMMNLAIAFRLPFFGNRPPPDLPQVERIVTRLEFILLSGKAMSLFSILFGVGLGIFLERAMARGAGATGAMWLLGRRLFFLLAFGLAHKFFIWHGDILTSYALSGFIALLFVQRKATGTGVVLAAAGVCFAWHVFGPLWPAAQSISHREAPEHFEQAMRVYGAGSYFDVVPFRIREVLRFEPPMYVFLVADELTRMLLGIAIWRSGILRLEVRNDHVRALRWIAFVGITFGLAYPFYRWVYFELYHPPRTVPPMAIMAFSNANPLICAIGYGAALLLLLRHAPWRKWLGYFAPLGRMAFTNYLMQSIVFSTLYYGYGFGLLGKTNFTVTALIGISFYAFQGIVSTIWLRHFAFGPFEWAWRSLTYGKPQPFRRRVEA